MLKILNKKDVLPQEKNSLKIDVLSPTNLNLKSVNEKNSLNLKQGEYET